MAELLNGGLPIATQDGYADALTLGPAVGVKRATLNVLGSAAVLVQCFRYIDPQRVDAALELVERTVPGQSIGIVLDCAGYRVRSATAGDPSNVTGALELEGDVAISWGTVTTAVLDANGMVVG